MKNRLKDIISKMKNLIFKLIDEVKFFGQTIIGFRGEIFSLTLGLVVLVFEIALIVVVLGITLAILPIGILIGLGYYGVKNIYEHIQEQTNLSKDKKELVKKYRNIAQNHLDYAVKRVEGIDVLLDQDGKSIIAEERIAVTHDELIDYSKLIKGKDYDEYFEYITQVHTLSMLMDRLAVATNPEEVRILKQNITSLEFRLQDEITKVNEYAIEDPEEAINSKDYLNSCAEKIRELKV